MMRSAPTDLILPTYPELIRIHGRNLPKILFLSHHPQRRSP